MRWVKNSGYITHMWVQIESSNDSYWFRWDTLSVLLFRGAAALMADGQHDLGSVIDGAVSD